MIKGIKVSSSLPLTQLLFVDYVVLFGVGTLEEWKDFDEILVVFSSASGMCISMEKSSFLYSEVEEEILSGISRFIPYKMDPIMANFKYLGYFLKP